MISSNPRLGKQLLSETADAHANRLRRKEDPPPEKDTPKENRFSNRQV
jgi:hypothetical protein